jgi:hypothetical protein
MKISPQRFRKDKDKDEEIIFVFPESLGDPSFFTFCAFSRPTTDAFALQVTKPHDRWTCSPAYANSAGRFKQEATEATEMDSILRYLLFNLEAGKNVGKLCIFMNREWTRIDANP